MAEQVAFHKRTVYREDIVYETVDSHLVSSEHWGWLRQVPGFQGFLQALSERIVSDLEQNGTSE